MPTDPLELLISYAITDVFARAGYLPPPRNKTAQLSRRASAVVADERLEGCQHYAFREYKYSKGESIISGHANGSVSFPIAQAHAGPGKVPISIVLYIDVTFVKRGIPMRPIYCKLVYDKA